MKAKQRLFDRLDALERDLRDVLLPALRRTVESREALFWIRSTDPYGLPFHTSSQGEALFQMAQGILRLADQLDEPHDGLLAARVVAYFQKSADLSDHHRGSDATLARQFLQELQSEPGGPE